jgi:2OG-Fe(II) oxygenase superfamily
VLNISSETLEALRVRWEIARPFRHVVLDGLFPDSQLRKILAEIPPIGSSSWTIWGSGSAGEIPSLGSKRGISSFLFLEEDTCDFLQLLASSTFVALLQSITGISGLVPDLTFNGGGLHCTGRGGFLRVHADKDRHPRPLEFRQAVNAIVMLCDEWQAHYGGDLELWSHDGARCITSIRPAFNRLVVMESGPNTYHGHPKPLQCPEDRFRLTIASYYYTRVDENASSQQTLQIRWL